MEIVTEAKLRKISSKFADSKKPLARWMVTIKGVEAYNLMELKRTFPKTDAVGPGKESICFDIKGNTYRLIVKINYAKQRVYIQDFLKHDDYNRKYPY